MILFFRCVHNTAVIISSYFTFRAPADSGTVKSLVWEPRDRYYISGFPADRASIGSDVICA